MSASADDASPEVTTRPSTSQSASENDPTNTSPAQADRTAQSRERESDPSDLTATSVALVANAAQKLKDTLADLRQQCASLGDFGVYISGNVAIRFNRLELQPHQISFVDDLEADPPSLGVIVKPLHERPTTNGNTRPPSHAPPAASPYPTIFAAPATTNFSDLDRALESDLIPRKKRKRDEEEGGDANGQDNAPKRPREDAADDEPPEPDEKDLMDMSRKELETLLAELRDDVQEDTAAGLNHLQRLIRRWREQWREKNGWLFDYFKLQHEEERRKKVWMEAKFKALEDALVSVPDLHIEDEPEDGEASTAPGAPGTPGTTVKGHKIMAQMRNLSNQIRWVEECRRIADEAHDAKEDTWRVTSATFHDGNRRNQEKHEKWLQTEIKRQSNAISQILTEVRGLSNLTMSLKWESPAAPHVPLPGPTTQPTPTFPRAAPPPFPTLPPELGRGRNNTVRIPRQGSG